MSSLSSEPRGLKDCDYTKLPNHRAAEGHIAPEYNASVSEVKILNTATPDASTNLSLAISPKIHHMVLWCGRLGSGKNCSIKIK